MTLQSAMVLKPWGSSDLEDLAIKEMKVVFRLGHTFFL